MIPTIRMHEYFPTAGYHWQSSDPYSPPSWPGQWTNATAQWYMPGDWTHEFVDIWEDGAPMVDGRIFQVPAAIPFSTLDAPLHRDMPYPMKRINIPIKYERGGDEQVTCMYNVGFGGYGYSCSFRGRFQLAGNPYDTNGHSSDSDGPWFIPPGYVPVYADSTCVNSAPFSVGLMSAVPFDLCMAHYYYFTEEVFEGGPSWGIVPVPHQWPPGDVTENQMRPALGSYERSPGNNYGYAIGRSMILGVEDIGRKTLKSGDDLTRCVDVRTYRRGDTTPIDWPGIWPPGI